MKTRVSELSAMVWTCETVDVTTASFARIPIQKDPATPPTSTIASAINRFLAKPVAFLVPAIGGPLVRLVWSPGVGYRQVLCGGSVRDGGDVERSVGGRTA